MSAVMRARIFAVLITAMVFLAIAPTLRWMEFAGGSEDLNVGTVLEMRRGGPWIIPTLKGAPRTTKPPLTAWITATAVRHATVAALSDLNRREKAYIDLAWESRWPSLLASCLMVWGTFELALLIAPGDAVFALTAMAISASNILFMRFSRAATTDVYLAFFVTITNVLFAKACFETRRRKVMAFLGGVALGLAFMSKGPAALAQCVAPVAMYWVWRKVDSRGGRGERPKVDWVAVILATVVSLAIALPWAVYANLKHPGQLDFWYAEAIEGGKALDFKPDPWWGYISTIPLMAPWVVMFVWGLGLIVCDAIDRRGDYARAMFAFLLAVGSIVVMSFIKQKNERYLLPMLAPLAIIAAYGLLRSPPRFVRVFRFLIAAQWGTIVAAAVGGPLAMALVRKLSTLDGHQWMTIPQAGLLGGFLLAIVIAAWIWDRRGKLGMPMAGLVVILILQMVYIRGYSRSYGGASEMRPLADAIWATAPHFKDVRNYNDPNEPHKVPVDLNIYVNRVVRPIVDPQKLSPAGVLVIGTAHKDANPPPAGFHKIASVPRGKEFWEAFVKGP